MQLFLYFIFVLILFSSAPRRRKCAYVIVLGDFEQIVHGRLQLVAGHGGDDHGIQLGCQLPHVLLISVHQTLEREHLSAELKWRLRSYASQDSQVESGFLMAPIYVSLMNRGKSQRRLARTLKHTYTHRKLTLIQSILSTNLGASNSGQTDTASSRQYITGIPVEINKDTCNK